MTASDYASSGDRIALGFDDGSIVVTDAGLGSPRTVAHIKDQQVWRLAFAGDERIAAAFDDGSIRVISVATGDVEQTLSGIDGTAYGVDASSDASAVVGAGSDGSVWLWRGGGSGTRLYKGAGAEWDVALSPDGRTILAVGDDGWVRRWDARTGREDARIAGGGDDLWSVAFSADGRRFAAGGQDATIRVWALGATTPVASIRSPSWVYDVNFGRSSDRVISAGDDGTARLWDAGDAVAWDVPGGPDGIAFNGRGDRIVTSSEDGVARVWNADDGTTVDSLSGLSDAFTAEFSPVKDTVVIADTKSPAVRTWAVGTGAAKVEFRAPKTKGIGTARFDRRGQRIVYADVNKKARLAVRTLESGREIALRGGTDTVYDAQFSPDGKQVAVTSASGVSPVWQVDSPGAPERLLKGHEGDENGINYGSDGRIVTAGADRTARVWPAREGTHGIVLQGHRSDVTDAAFWPDGSKVLTISLDRTLRLWNSRTGAFLGVLDTSPVELHSMEVTGDGRIAILDGNDVIRVMRCEVCGSLAAVETRARSLGPRQLTADERERYLNPAD